MACLRGRLVAVLIISLSAFSPLAFAASPSATDQRAAELNAAFDAARKVAQLGPAKIKLDEQAVFKLPRHFVFIPRKEAGQLMHAYGNRTGDDLLGVIFPTGKKSESWFVVMRFVKEGYVKDDDAKRWNADDMLVAFKEGTAEGNKDRQARGIPEIEIVGWVESPRYDAGTHQLVWAMSSRDKGAGNAAGQGINYNTYTLGREGYISMNLVTDLDAIEKHKPIAKQLLGGLTFVDGKRYADFDGSTDKVAAYGLAALVGGVAAKKLGLFALMGVFLAKFWKIAVVAVVAVAGGAGIFSKLRKRA